jgi:hypothetical protein
LVPKFADRTITPLMKRRHQECGRKPRLSRLTPTIDLYAKCNGRNLGDTERIAVIMRLEQRPF